MAAAAAGSNAILARGQVPKNLRAAKKERRARAIPALVPSKAVDRAMRAAKTVHGPAALPLFQARGVPGATHRERLKEWLLSDEGKAWQAEKKERFEDALS